MTQIRPSPFPFPPTLTVGSRVWTDSGYKDHGPMEGPRIDIAPNQGGTIATTQEPYYTHPDRVLYVVRWDNGQVSKHYETQLLPIGRFQTRAEFEAAIKPMGTVKLTVGPGGGFKHVDLDLEYDGHAQSATITDVRLWRECVEPIVKRLGLPVSTTKLPMKKRSR